MNVWSYPLRRTWGGSQRVTGPWFNASLHLGNQEFGSWKDPQFLGGPLYRLKKSLLVSNAQKWKTEQEEMKRGWKSKIVCWSYKVMGGLKWYSDMPKPCNQSAKRLGYKGVLCFSVTSLLSKREGRPGRFPVFPLGWKRPRLMLIATSPCGRIVRRARLPSLRP